MPSPGLLPGQMPTLCRFDLIGTSTPPAKKPRLQHIEPVADANNYLPSSCDNCLDDMKTIFNLSMDLLRARKTRIVPEEDYSELMKSLSTFKTIIDSEYDRFAQIEAGAALNSQAINSPAVNSPAVIYTPDSPVSETELTPVPLGIEPSPGCKRSTEGVVHGTGVIATENFKKGQEICPYDGPLVFRILNQSNGKHHVFKLRDMGNDGSNDIEFLDSDTYAAWSGVVIAKGGRPAIELGRDCDHDIRFLNHSKEPNVMIRYIGGDRIKWGDRDSLRLTVVALKDIRLGEELLLDYDINKPDSEIDFSISAVEIATEEYKKKITTRVNDLNLNKSGRGGKKPAKTLEKELQLPEELDEEIAQIMKKIGNIKTNSGHPANIYQVKRSFSENHKKLLSIIFSDNGLVLEDLASYLSSVKKTKTKSAFMDELKTDDVKHHLIRYLKRVVFNDKCSWVTVEELKENFASFNKMK